MLSYHIQVHRSSKQKHGGYLNNPDVQRGTRRADSRRRCHTMALGGGEGCLRSQEPCRLHGPSDIPPPRTTRACAFQNGAHFSQNLSAQTASVALHNALCKPAAVALSPISSNVSRGDAFGWKSTHRRRGSAT